MSEHSWNLKLAVLLCSEDVSLTLTQPRKYVLTLKEMLCHLVTEEPAWAFPYMARELPMLEGIP